MADGALTIKVDARTQERLAEIAREEGKSPEQVAAELVSEFVNDDVPPGFLMSEEALRASLTEQMRRIESGEAELIPHDQVMEEMRAITAEAKARKA